MKCISCDYRQGHECCHPANPRPVRLSAARIMANDPCRRDLEEEQALWAYLNRSWTAVDEQFLINHLNWPTLKIAQHLQRGEVSVLEKRAELRRVGHRTRRWWTKQEDRIIMTYYPRLTCTQIAAMLPGRTASQVKDRANKTLGLKRRRDAKERSA